MSKRANDAAMKKYPVCIVRRRYDGIARSDDTYDSNSHERYVFQKGYEQAEKDTLERAIEWWRPRLCGFLKEGLTEGVLEEFRKAMEE